MKLIYKDCKLVQIQAFQVQLFNFDSFQIKTQWQI